MKPLLEDELEELEDVEDELELLLDELDDELLEELVVVPDELLVDPLDEELLVLPLSVPPQAANSAIELQNSAVCTAFWPSRQAVTVNIRAISKYLNSILLFDVGLHATFIYLSVIERGEASLFCKTNC